MRKLVKNFIVMLVLVLGILPASSVFAEINIPDATTDFYVNDFADVLSPEEESRLMSNAVKLAEESDGIQVVVTTVNNLDGASDVEYATKMYNKYAIGKNDMGVLILISIETRDFRITPGRAMSSYLTASKLGELTDEYAIPYLSENKFNEGLISIQEAIISEIKTRVPEKVTGSITTDKPVNESGPSPALIVFLWLLFILAIIGVIFFFIRKSISKKKAMKKEIASLNKQLTNAKNDLVKERVESQKAIDNARNSLINEYNGTFRTIKANHATEIKSYEEKIDELEKKIKNITSQAETVYNSYTELDIKHNALIDRYERAKILYPSVDDEITSMIEEEIRQKDMKKAAEIDSLIAKVIDLEANKDIVERLKSVVDTYSSLEERQKQYVKSDIDKLNQLYKKSVELKDEFYRKLQEEQERKQKEQDQADANKAYTSIQAIISSISVGKAKDLDNLNQAKSIYKNLNGRVLQYFDSSIMDKVDNLLEQAEKDHELQLKIAKDKKAAAAAVGIITGIIGCIYQGKERHLSDLKRAQDAYDDLNSDEKQYVDSSIISKLNELIREAKKDKEDNEEAERRRRMNDDDDDFHNFGGPHHFGGSSRPGGGFSGHSGFGGRSDGYGTSRKF